MHWPHRTYLPHWALRKKNMCHLPPLYPPSPHQPLCSEDARATRCPTALSWRSHKPRAIPHNRVSSGSAGGIKSRAVHSIFIVRPPSWLPVCTAFMVLHGCQLSATSRLCAVGSVSPSAKRIHSKKTLANAYKAMTALLNVALKLLSESIWKFLSLYRCLSCGPSLQNRSRFIVIHPHSNPSRSFQEAFGGASFPFKAACFASTLSRRFRGGSVTLAGQPFSTKMHKDKRSTPSALWQLQLQNGNVSVQESCAKEATPWILDSHLSQSKQLVRTG